MIKNNNLTLYIQLLRQSKVLITEQQVNDTNPLFELAIITHRLQP
jgi:hypothetical protein